MKEASEDHLEQYREAAEKLASAEYKPHRFGDGPAWFAACVRLAQRLLSLEASQHRGADSESKEISAFIERRDAQRKWLKENHPSVFSEQKHLDDGSVERAYWHYGYTVALTDALAMFGVPRTAAKEKAEAELRSKTVGHESEER